MKQPKAPCLGCKTRAPACQPQCEKFITYRQQHEVYKTLVEKARGEEKRMDNFKLERVTASLKMAGR